MDYICAYSLHKTHLQALHLLEARNKNEISLNYWCPGIQRNEVVPSIRRTRRRPSAKWGELKLLQRAMSKWLKQEYANFHQKK